MVRGQWVNLDRMPGVTPLLFFYHPLLVSLTPLPAAPSFPRRSPIRLLTSSTLLSFSGQPDLGCRVIWLPLKLTYEVMITSLSYSSALMSERIKCSISLVDNHTSIHNAIYAVC